jgi:hypothetical protein
MNQAYNYARFRVKHHPMDHLPGPVAGEPAVDFTAHTLDGRQVRLSDFFGQILVLETGSITCPHYTGNVAPMRELARDYPEALFLLLYVREAHPGSKIRPHGSLDQKLAVAGRLRGEEGENRMVLVDDVDGTAHKAYGEMPNMIYVIDESGRVIHRSEWASQAHVRRVLDRLRHQQPVSPTESYGMNLKTRKVIPTFHRAGIHSLLHFLAELPRVVAFHFRRKEAYPE